MNTSLSKCQNEMPISILTGVFDQSALQSLLRYLYSLGIPLLSVICLGGGEHDNDLNAYDSSSL